MIGRSSPSLRGLTLTLGKDHSKAVCETSLFDTKLSPGLSLKTIWTLGSPQSLENPGKGRKSNTSIDKRHGQPTYQFHSPHANVHYSGDGGRLGERRSPHCHHSTRNEFLLCLLHMFLISNNQKKVMSLQELFYGLRNCWQHSKKNGMNLMPKNKMILTISFVST